MAFIVITAFVVVNLLIAVICDAVHVLGDDVKDGLIGEDSDANILAGELPPLTPTERRLEELEYRLSEMMQVQDQMKISIEMLVKQLRESKAREAESSSIESGSLSSDTRIKKKSQPIADMLSEEASHSRIFWERTSDGDPSEEVSLGDPSDLFVDNR